MRSTVRQRRVPGSVVRSEPTATADSVAPEVAACAATTAGNVSGKGGEAPVPAVIEGAEKASAEAAAIDEMTVDGLRAKYHDGTDNIVRLDPEFGMRCRLLEGHEDVPYAPFITSKGLKALRAHFTPTERDIFVTTSPKCGTTWMQQIALLILHRGDVSKMYNAQTQAPWPERWLCQAKPHPQVGALLDIEHLNAPDGGGLAINGRRVFKTHAPVGMFPAKGGAWEPARIVYVARNPKDAAVSAFHHNSSIISHDYKGPWDHFVRMYEAGQLEHGSWFDHMRDWWAEHLRRPDRVLWVNFEELKADASATIARIAKFLDVPLTKEELAAVVEHSSLPAMKAQAKARAEALAAAGGPPPRQTRRAGGASHLREGRSGGWKNWFTVAQSERMDALVQEKLSGCHGLTLYYGSDLEHQALHFP